ncbi:hypothetical protein V500_07273 [Pseudogymnoascus sp. VKM F-4518 (FW-2643)]|nr:hypothetical protein V500_07273 [Pseudogymnoascus sp. VKM F-4518 (FW-2643)]
MNLVPALVPNRATIQYTISRPRPLRQLRTISTTTTTTTTFPSFIPSLSGAASAASAASFSTRPPTFTRQRPAAVRAVPEPCLHLATKPDLGVSLNKHDSDSTEGTYTTLCDSLAEISFLGRNCGFGARIGPPFSPGRIAYPRALTRTVTGRRSRP